MIKSSISSLETVIDPCIISSIILSPSIGALILYSIGSKNLPAADLTLLSLTEVLGGIFWVWLPILGINEIPSQSTIIGGFLIFLSIVYYSLIIRTNRRFIGLN